MASGTASVFLKLTSDSSQWAAGLKKAGSSLTQLGRGVSRVGDALSLGVTVPLVAAATAAIKFSFNFSRAMADIATLIPGNTARCKS